MSHGFCQHFWNGRFPKGLAPHDGMCLCSESEGHEGRCVCKCGTQAFFRAYKLKRLNLSPVPYKRRKAAR